MPYTPIKDANGTPINCQAPSPSSSSADPNFVPECNEDEIYRMEEAILYNLNKLI